MMTGWSTPWLTRVSSKVVSPRLHTQTDRSNQQTQRIAHGFVVVNPLNQRRKGAACRWVGRRHGFLHFPQGFFASASDSLNTSPRGVLWPAEIYAAAVGGLIFVKLKSPAASSNAARLQHITLFAVFQRQAQPAGVGRHRPFARGHDGVGAFGSCCTLA